MKEQDILNYMSTLSGEDFRKLEDKIGQARWTDAYQFPAEMYQWFRGGISKHRGDAWENQYVATCASLGPKTNGDHDATLDVNLVNQYGLKGQTVEIKFFTAMVPDSAKQIEKEVGHCLGEKEHYEYSRIQRILRVGQFQRREHGNRSNLTVPTMDSFQLFTATALYTIGFHITLSVGVPERTTSKKE